MKKFLALTLALVLCLGLAACGGAPSSDEPKTDDKPAEGETVTLKVGATPTPHAEILTQVKDILAEEGIELEIVEYSDYNIPNVAVDEGELDANYYQHTPYMENFNAQQGTHLASAGSIHYEPMGIYAGKTTSIDALPDGAVIAVPNDTTNEARALLLLQSQGLIELDPEAGIEATPNDITANPKNLSFKEMDAAMLAQTIGEVDLSIINSNFALQGGLDPTADSLASEAAVEKDATTYGNIIAVKEGHENDEAIQALVKALQSDKVKEFIKTTYKGAVVPTF